MTQFKLRAERGLGALLAEMPKHPPGPEPDQSHDVTEPPTLKELGIDRMQSSRWQMEASVPDDAQSWFLDDKFMS